MDEKTMREALRAAAKVALSALAGTTVACSGAVAPEDGAATQACIAANPAGGEGSQGGAGSASSGGSSATTARDASADAPATVVATRGDAGAPSAAACEARLASFRPDGGTFYPGTALPRSTETDACCRLALADTEAPEPLFAQYRWDCCATLDGMNDPSLGMACTPWGPPMPPSMSRVARRSPHPSPWGLA